MARIRRTAASLHAFAGPILGGVALAAAGVLALDPRLFAQNGAPLGLCGVLVAAAAALGCATRLTHAATAAVLAISLGLAAVGNDPLHGSLLGEIGWLAAAGALTLGFSGLSARREATWRAAGAITLLAAQSAHGLPNAVPPLAMIIGALALGGRLLPAQRNLIEATPTPVVALGEAGLPWLTWLLVAQIALAPTAAGTVFGVALLLLGAAIAVGGGLHALRAADLASVLAGHAALRGGFVVAGLAVTRLTRDADLGQTAALALGGTAALIASEVVLAPLLVLVLGRVAETAGSTGLDRLGGLARVMPRLSMIALASLPALALSPPSPGFAALWAIVSGLAGAARSGGLIGQAAMLVAACGLAVAAGLAWAATLRAVGVAFLGRPRTPRGSAAQDPGRRTLVIAAVLALGVVLLGSVNVDAIVLPLLNGEAAGMRLAWATPEGSLYAPLGLAALVGACALALGWWQRRGSKPHVAPAWQGGRDEAPAWLPFGDPAEQTDPAAHLAPLYTLAAALLAAGRVGRR